MRKKRYNYSSEKVIILKCHLVGREMVSDLCDEHQLQPNRFYGWQKQFFEKGAARPTSGGLGVWWVGYQ